jgi:hypothetical protein
MRPFITSLVLLALAAPVSAQPALKKQMLYEWRYIKGDDSQVVLCQNGTQVGNYSYDDNYYRSYDAKAGEWGEQEAPPMPPPDRTKAAEAATQQVIFEWRFFRGDDSQVALYKDGTQIGSYSYDGDYYRSYDAKADEWGDKTTSPISPPDHDEVATAVSQPSALMEVNAARAQRGLPPFMEDDGLTVAAQAAAVFRATNLIAGHTSNDFGFLPPGSSAQAAGCAAWEPWMGWGSCCAYEHWRYAGAGWALGRDGRRYMHLFVK